MSNALMLSLANPQPGREQEYQDWYANQHLGDLIKVPSVLEAKLHKVTDHAPSRWRHAAIYQLAGDAQTALAEIMDYGKAGKIEPSTASDPGDRIMGLATPISERVGGPANPDNVVLVVFSNPHPGQDDEYNRWYTDEHLADVLAVPGFVAAQRYSFASPAGAPAPEWNYLALYEIAADQVDEAFPALYARAADGRMPISPALDVENISMTPYRPIAVKAKAEATS
jgi:hypothetical protein